MLNTLNLRPEIVAIAEGLGFENFSEIQELAIPKLVQNKNIILKAPTGTGKTHAFLFPILQNIDPSVKKTQAIIFTPTRELAQQTERVVKQALAFYDQPISFYSVIGGKDRGRGVDYLKNNQPQILIGTPGRIEDMIAKEKLIDLRAVKNIVFDETDMIVENGFIESIDTVLQMLPQANKITYAVASATVSQEVRIFIKKYIKNIDLIEVSKAASASDKVEHLLVETNNKNRDKDLLDLLATIQPFLVVIFANTKKQVDHLVGVLQEQNYKVGFIHGDLQSRERAKMLRRIHQLEFQYVVASDIAARGIDIDGVSHVINFELPDVSNIEFYAHRAGRTGRMNYDGTIISLYSADEQFIVDKLRQLGVEFQQMKVKDGSLVEKKVRKIKELKPADEKLISISKQAKRSAHRSKKVKPGYKKKIKHAVNKAIQFEQRKSNKQKKKNDRRSRGD